MDVTLRKIRKFRASLGPVEQAQIVASTAVVVAMVTIVTVRLLGEYKLDWYDLVSVITVGIFGFLIVYFTLKYGRYLEEQRQELLALNTIAEAVNRAVEINYLLQNALQEVRRLLDVDYGWVYLVENERLVLKATKGTEELDSTVIANGMSINDAAAGWVRSPRIQKRPRKNDQRSEWPFSDFEAWASVPLMTKDTLSGAIVLASKERDVFSDKQLQLMSAVANQIGIALENAALFERLRKSEERYIDLFEHSPDMYSIVNRYGTIVSVNQTEADRLGYRKEELLGKSILKLYPPDQYQDAQRLLEQVFEQNHEVKGVEQQMVTSTGELVDVSVSTSIIYDESRQPMLMRTVARDITEKKKLESKVIHAQRIDSIGNLAGGVAHDFNNILTSILGSTSIMKRKMKQSDTWYRFVDIIEMAAKRGAGLTRQLLTFARKTTVQFRPVLITDIVEETVQFFERSVDKTIQLKTFLNDRDSIVNGDDGQIQQAILNLLINARDAMPDGGTITIETRRTSVDSQRAASLSEARSGDFVQISVTDTGVGMSPQIQQRIFEPFFTTKDQGKGTGLGLSVVYGVVNSHNGFIAVQSAVGEGSQFTLYFPLMQEAERVRSALRESKVYRGKERVLVVDDEEHVGNVIGGMLKTLGYRVTTVKSGKEAIDSVKKKKHYDAVVLDMNMPTMGGKETFVRLKELDPDLAVIVSTGYSNTVIEGTPLHDTIDAFLQKPYQIEELSKTMHAVFSKRRSAIKD
ncbi:MAG TPA: PAS domain S-box protein [Bacteroidota bacterium]|nr:PAS domain S-box protein [Bacteroidota bacterium]